MSPAGPFLAYASLARLRACEAHGIRPTSLRPFTVVSSGWLLMWALLQKSVSNILRRHHTHIMLAKPPVSIVGYKIVGLIP